MFYKILIILFVSIFSILFFLSFVPLSFRVNDGKDTYSRPIIIIDFDNDGFDLIPLEKSEALFDIDGDGEKEHTAWVETWDGFLMTYTIQESFTFKKVDERIFRFMTGGFKELLQSDKNGDYKYNEIDRDILRREGGSSLLDAGIFSGFDKKGHYKHKFGFALSSMCKSPREFVVEDNFDEDDYLGIKVTGRGRLNCKNASYGLLEVRFPYEEQSVR